MSVRKLLSIVGVVLLLLAAAGAVVFWRGWSELREPYKGYSAAEQFVTIRQGASSSEIGGALDVRSASARCFGSIAAGTSAAAIRVLRAEFHRA